MCQFFENFLMSDEDCKVPVLFSDSQTCICVAGINFRVTCTCLGPGLCQCASVSDTHGITPLHIACTRPDLPVIQFLLEQGAAVNALTASQSLTPLQVVSFLCTGRHGTKLCMSFSETLNL